MKIIQYYLLICLLLLQLIFLPVIIQSETLPHALPQNMTWKGSKSNQKNEFIKVVETRKEWHELWTRAFDQPVPDMNFEKYVVACVFLGHSADWLYSISFGQPFLRDNVLVIPFSCAEIILELSGPFKASGQYHMKVFAKKKNVKMVLEESVQSSRGKK